MDLNKFKEYHKEVNRFLDNLIINRKDVTISEVVLVYGIRCEQLGYTHTDLTLEELDKVGKYDATGDSIIELATIMYGLVPKALLTLRLRESIRKCETEDDLYKIMLKAYESTTLVNENRKQYTINLEDIVSEKLLAITTIAMFYSKELATYFTPKGRRLLCNNEDLLSEVEESDYLSNGSFLIYPPTTMKFIEKSLSRRKLETLAQINYRFREEFLSDKEDKRYEFLNSKEIEIVSEVQELVRHCASLITCNGKSSVNVRLRLVQDTEDKILDYLETLQVKQDNLTRTLQDVTFKIVEEFDVSNANLVDYMQKSAERVLEGCRNEIEDILEIVSNIHNTTLRLSNFSAKLDSSEQRVNSNKRALLRKYQGMNEAKRWMAIIMSELLETLRYYCGYINSETVERYKVEKPIDKTIEKEIKKVDRDLNKKLKNIYCYKELNRIAIDKGYSKVRQKGDHGIFRKSDGSVVVIPQGRDIGKGLSIRIQKDCNRE